MRTAASTVFHANVALFNTMSPLPRDFCGKTNTSILAGFHRGSRSKSALPVVGAGHHAQGCSAHRVEAPAVHIRAQWNDPVLSTDQLNLKLGYAKVELGKNMAALSLVSDKQRHTSSIHMLECCLPRH